jgi:type II secretory pathway predicted ATPase ExeA
MLLDYYNLKEQPFGVTPDPRYLYMSASHREALASLSYGIKNGRGFMSLIAQPGMGKTTILFQLLSQLKDSARTVFLFQTLCGPQELLHDLLRDLGVARIGKSVVRMQQQLNEVLLTESRQGRKVVVVIDEAQNLEDAALELLRMLSNFETSSDKMMQIVLAGQPQLRDKLASPNLLQLRQRMSIFARLSPLNVEETHLYIEHRLRVAGCDSRTPMFTPVAEALIAKHGEGIPRNINNICFNALSLGWVSKQRTIKREVVAEVLRDLDLVTREDTSELYAEPAGRAWIGWSAIRVSSAFQQAFAWRKRLAIFAALLLPLIWLSGPDRKARAGGPVELAATSVTSQQRLASMSLPNPQSAPAADSTPPLHADAAGPTSQAVSGKHHANRSRKSQPRSEPDSPQTSDIDELWNQVKHHRSAAEVKLARMYLEGTAVPRNCIQAQILLQDASRKGNTSAADLLNGPLAQCQQSQ